MLSKAYEPQKYEDEIYKRWEESGFFNPDNLSGDPYSIMMPPPNVTGVLHLGHALENSLMDVMARFQRMNGKKLLLLPGTDHAAVATQARVEKNLVEKGIKNPREHFGREGLLKEIREYAENSKSIILNQIKKMGTSCDWSRLAYTFDEDRSQAVNEVFKKMYDDGLIYRGYRTINWSVKGQSTCSDDELVYVDRKAKIYTFKYSKDFPFSIATTRPETKLGDTAVAVNPNDSKYKKYIGQIFEVNFCGVDLKIKIIADEHVDPEFGTGALGVTPAHSPVDFEMYERKKVEGDEIGLIQVIGQDGKMTVQAGKEFAGLSVEEAREKVLEKLREQNLLEAEEEIEQSVGTSDRFGDVVEALPMTQWFVAVNKIILGKNKTLKQLMKEAVETGHNGDPNQKVKITPDRFEKIYYNWIDNLRDWCISRQVWWGHRIPSYLDIEKEKNHGAILVAKGLDSSLKNKFKKRYLAIKEELQPLYENPETTEQHTKEAVKYIWAEFEDYFSVTAGLLWKSVEKKELTLEQLQKIEFLKVDINNIGQWESHNNTEKIKKSCIQDPDTLDTWFSSGLWTFSTLGWPNKTEDLKNFHPTNWMQMGHEILFFWMARMILMSTYVLDEIPFKDVYIHGILRDKDGKKFSKSSGNGIDPLDVIKEYGTDALRFSLLSGITPGNDSRFYLEKVEAGRNLVNKFWNINRFVIGKLQEVNYDLEKEIKLPEAKTLADQYILIKINSLVDVVSGLLESYQFSLTVEHLRDFTWNEFADWYLEIVKIEGNKSEILNYVLNVLLKLWHPFTPFVTEAIWKELYGEESFLMVEKWPKKDKVDNMTGDLDPLENFYILKNIVTQIRSLRADYKIEPAKKLNVVISAGEKTELLNQNAEVIKGLARLENLQISQLINKPENSIGFVESGVEVFINLEGVVDIEKEKDRLNKEIEQLEKYVNSLDKKLSNQEFVNNAPTEVVEKEKEKLSEGMEKLKKINQQLNNLK